MGIVSIPLSQSNNMKFLLVLAVAAYVSAEADPQFAYTVGHPLVYNHLPLAYHHVPLVYTAAAGCRNNDGAVVPCAHGVLPALAPFAVAAAPAEAEEEAVVSVEKREAEPTAEADAEADPEADPWLYYHGLGYAGHHYGYGYHGLGLGYAGYHGYAAAYHPYAYRHSGYGAYGYYGKRSADAEPTAEAAAEADPWVSYYGLGYVGHHYGYGYHGLGLGYAGYAGYHPYAYYGGCRNNYGALVPCAGK